MRLHSKRVIGVFALLLGTIWLATSSAAGSADLSRLVIVGDGFLAGFRSGGLVASGQRRSAGALVARQVGADLPLPLVSAPGLLPALDIVDANGNGRLDAHEVRRPDTRLGSRRARGNARLLAVPGEDTASVFDAVTERGLVPALTTGAALGVRDVLKPVLLDSIGADQAVSQLGRARALDPSFLLVWLGNTDALRLIPVGGAPRAPVSPEEFGRRFTRMLDILAETGADMAVANVPDPTLLPVLRRAAGEITSCRAADGERRPVDFGDLVAIAVDPDRLTSLSCSLVLTAADRARVRDTVAAYNREIAAAVGAVEQRHGTRIAIVDVFALFDRLGASGVDVDGDGTAEFTTGYLGGLFGLDGVHPTRLGHALIANTFIDAVNARFGAGIRPVRLARAARDRLAISRFRPAGEPPFGLLADGADETILGLPRRLLSRVARKVAALGGRLRTAAEPDFTPAVPGVPGSYLMFTGVETADPLEVDVAQQCPVVTAPVCTGTRACQLTNVTPALTLTARPMGIAEAYVRSYHRADVTANPSPTEACSPILGFDTNQVVALCAADVCVQPDGQLRYRLTDRINGVTVGTPTASVPASVWRRVEVRSLMRPGVADDECELRLDGVTVAAATTLNLGTGLLDAGFLSNRQAAYPQPATPGSWLAAYDDMAMTQFQWPGTGRVIARQGRAGAPTYNQFTLLDAATIQGAWSDTPANPATRAVSLDAGDPVAQTMLVAPFDAGANPITAGAEVSVCQTWLSALTLGPRDRQYAIRRRVGGLDVDTVLPGIEAFTLVYSDGLRDGFWAASLANLNAAEIGARKAGGAGGAPMAVNDAWLACEYQPPPAQENCLAATPTTTTSTTLPPLVQCLPAWGATPNGAILGFANYADGVRCTTGTAAGGYVPQSCSIALGAGGAGSIRCAIYTDVPDPNRTALCSSAVGAAVPNSVNTLPLTGCPTLASNTNYWIVWNTDNDAIRYRVSDAGCNGPSGVSRYVTAGFPTGAWSPSPWGGTSPDTCRVISFMTLSPAAGLPTTTSSTSSSSTSSSSTSTSSTSSSSSSVTSTTSSSSTSSTSAVPTTTSSTVIAATTTSTSSTTSTTLGGLVAAYGFSEGLGPTTADASGNGNTAAISGATWTTAGRFGNALLFDGLNDLLNVADSASLDITRMTLEAWVFPTAPLQGWRTVVGKERPGGFAYFLHANRQGTNRPTTGVFIGAERLLSGGTAVLPANTWTHLAATYDGAAQRLFVNGAQVATRVQTGNIAVSGNPLRIGGSVLFGEFFQGRIDEVRVYNRALGAAEIVADRDTGVGP